MLLYTSERALTRNVHTLLPECLIAKMTGQSCCIIFATSRSKGNLTDSWTEYCCNKI